MKKSIFSIAALLSVFLIFGCANSSDSSGASPSGEDIPISEQTFDFTIKKKSATQSAARSARAAENEKHYVLTEPFIDPEKNDYVIFRNDLKDLGVSKEDVISLFKLEANHTDDIAGIKVTFTKPQSLLTLESQGYYYNMFNVTYIDGNENYSSRMNYYTWRDGEEKRTVFYYPLVQPNTDATALSVAIMYVKDNKTYEISSLYVIDTITGLGTIDNLPRGANDDVSHIVTDGLSATVRKVIPPDNMKGLAKNMKKTSCLFYTDGTDSESRWKDIMAFGNKYEELTDESALSIDLSMSFNPYMKTKKNNIFVQLVYSFTIDGYEGVEFFTPELLSDFVPITSVSYDLSDLGYWTHSTDNDAPDATVSLNSDGIGVIYDDGNGGIFKSGNSVSITVAGSKGTISETKIEKHFYVEGSKTYKVTYEKDEEIKIHGFWGDALGWKGIGDYDGAIGFPTENEDGSYSISFTSAATEEINLNFKFEENATDGTYTITNLKIEEVTE